MGKKKSSSSNNQSKAAAATADGDSSSSSNKKKETTTTSDTNKNTTKKEEEIVVEAEEENENDDDDDDDVPPEMELLQVDLGDMIKLKQILDETVTIAILENNDDIILEDYTWDNIKLCIMSIACIFAMIAQFAPLPFPESRFVLGMCGTFYFVFSGILQFITTFIDRDAILLTKPIDLSVLDQEEEEEEVVESKNNKKNKKKEDSSLEKKQKQEEQELSNGEQMIEIGKPKIWEHNKDMEKYGLRVRSNLMRFSEWYTVTLEFRMDHIQKDHSLTEKPKVPQFVEQKWSIGQFFDKDGYFDEIGFMMEVDKVLERFVEQQYDIHDNDDKKKEGESTTTTTNNKKKNNKTTSKVEEENMNTKKKQ